MYSPIVQNEKHINIIKDIMANEKILDKNHLDVIVSGKINLPT